MEINVCVNDIDLSTNVVSFVYINMNKRRCLLCQWNSNTITKITEISVEDNILGHIQNFEFWISSNPVAKNFWRGGFTSTRDKQNLNFYSHNSNRASTLIVLICICVHSSPSPGYGPGKYDQFTEIPTDENYSDMTNDLTNEMKKVKLTKIIEITRINNNNMERYIIIANDNMKY